MAISVAHLATAGSGTDGTSFSSASITPTAGRLIIASYAASRTDNIEPTTPTTTGNGLTWVDIDSFYYNTDQGARDEKMFLVAANTGGSPSAGAVTFSHGATTHHAANWTIFECDGTDVGNGVAQCFVQVVKSTTNTAATSVTVTLASATHSDNRPFHVNVHHQEELVTPRANWTEIGDAGNNNPDVHTESQWRSDTFETTTSASWTGNVRRGAWAFEIKASGAGAPLVSRRMLLGVGQ